MTRIGLTMERFHVARVRSLSAFIVLLICVHAFLLGNGVFRGKFENEPIPWYFLAKGIFCSLGLYLRVRVIEK